MKKLWPNFKEAYCKGVHVEGPSETTKDSWSPNKDLNPGFIYAYSIIQKFLIEGRKEKELLKALNCFRTIFMTLSLILLYTASSATGI